MGRAAVNNVRNRNNGPPMDSSPTGTTSSVRPNLNRSTSATSNALNNPKPRITKTEKIRQLQMEVERCKEDIRRIQKDRKDLRRELESKGVQVEALHRELENHVEETSNLKQQLLSKESD